MSGDLPALKVLGWDDADTALHIDHVHQTLKERLHWPEEDSDLESLAKAVVLGPLLSVTVK